MYFSSYLLSSADITFWYKERDQAIVDDLVKEAKGFLREEVKEGKSTDSLVSLLLPSASGRLLTVSRCIGSNPKTKEHLDLLYKTGFEELVDFIIDTDGLAILRGEPGSGKTSMIRDAVDEAYRRGREDAQPYSPEVVYLTSDNVDVIGQAAFIDFLINNHAKTYICEDAESVLQKDVESNRRSKATSNLLNLTDGILSDITQSGFLTSLNCDLDKIDPALLRKGRCKLLIESEKLSPERAYKYWSFRYEEDKEGINVPVKLEDSINISDLSQLFIKRGES